MWKRLFLAIFILLAFEVGLFLMMFPWSLAWENNYFLSSWTSLKGILMSPYIRGAVSGLGLLKVCLGIGEACHVRDRIRDLETREAAEQAARLTLEKT